MNSIQAGAGLACTLLFAAMAHAQDSDLKEGADLYRSQCMVCHGKIVPDKAAASGGSRFARVLLAMHQGAASRPDFSSRLIAGTDDSAYAGAGANRDLFAFAPPFGPNLRGVVGRKAGSVEGFAYSQTFMSTLAGMEWTEAALNVWITSPQAWVPGVYMFYKQPDPEIRRKIILYLKANP